MSVNRSLKILLTISALFWSAFVVSEPAESDTTKKSEDRCITKGECGWWWGFMDKDEKEPEKFIPKPKMPEQAKGDKDSDKKPKRCMEEATWTPSCGFVDPKGSFEFQAKQRDALFKQAAMQPGSPKAVKALQQYHQWISQQATQMSSMWEYNMLQDPSLSGRAVSPINTFGLKVMLKLNEERNDDVIAHIRDEGGVLVWFTRNDCVFCEKMKFVVMKVAKDLDLPVWNASLDDTCFPYFKELNMEALCMTKSATIKPAEMLDVQMVPSMYLHVPTMDLWVRVSVGMEAVSTIKRRIRVFFEAAVKATAKGMNKTLNQEAVDFSGDKYEQGVREGYGARSSKVD